MTLLPLDGTSTVPINYRDTVAHVIANNISPADTDAITGDINAIGFRNNGTDFSGNTLGHKALPVTHSISIRDFLGNADLSGVNDPDAGFEYGVGAQSIRDSVSLSGLFGLTHYENAIRCNYFDTLSEPISDISGLSLHVGATGADFAHHHFAQVT